MRMMRAASHEAKRFKVKGFQVKGLGAIGAIAISALLAGAPAWADTVPEVKGNDTGGIIASALATQTDVRQIAVDHCASYGKVVKFLAVVHAYGGYISFACRAVPYAANDRPLRVKY